MWSRPIQPDRLDADLPLTQLINSRKDKSRVSLLGVSPDIEAEEKSKTPDFAMNEINHTLERLIAGYHSRGVPPPHILLADPDSALSESIPTMTGRRYGRNS